MKTEIRKVLYGLLMLAGLTSCDKIEEGKYRKPQSSTPPPTNTDNGDTTLTFGTPFKTVLLEDCTGHLCVNCPTAADRAKSLKDKYGEQVVVMSVHLSEDADPYPAPSKFSYNFHTTEGDLINQQFGVSKLGLPQGLINRKKSGADSYCFLNGIWPTLIDTILQGTPSLNLAVKAIYSSGTNAVSVNFGAKFLKALTGNLNIGVYLTEDSIIQAQAYPGNKTVDNYVFRHTLRTSATGVFGQALQAGSNLSYAVNQTVYKHFTIPLKNDWIPKRLTVVACIMNASTYEILEVVETHVQ